MRIASLVAVLAFVGCGPDDLEPGPEVGKQALLTHETVLSGLWANRTGEPPPGALTVADNVVLSEAGVLEPRRGFELLASDWDGPVNALTVFRGELIAHTGASTLRHSIDDGATWSVYPGEYEAPAPDARVRFWESSDSLFFVAADGVYELMSPDDVPRLTGVVRARGAEADIVQDPSNGWLPANTQVAYQVAWDSVNSNGHLQQGAASAPSVVISAPTRLVPSADVHRISEFETRVTASNHGFESGDLVTVTLSGEEELFGAGTFPVTRVDANTFTYIDQVSAGGGGTANHYVTYRFAPRSVRLRISVPPSLRPGSTLRIYRSPRSATADTAPPSARGLIAELQAPPVGASNIITFLDSTPLALLGPNEDLATRASRPPAANEAAVWRGVTYYADIASEQVTTVRLRSLFGLDPGAMLAVGTEDTLVPLIAGNEEQGAVFLLHLGGTPEENVYNTAQSIVRTLNRAYGDRYTATYVVEDLQPPGTIRIQRHGTPDRTFGVYAFNAPGTAFDPPVVGVQQSVSVTRVGSTVRATSGAPHGWVVGQVVTKTRDTANFPGGLKTITAAGLNTFEYLEEGPVAASESSQFRDHVEGGRSTGESQANLLMASVADQPWKVPAANRLTVGAPGTRIERIFPTEDSLVIFTNNGIFLLYNFETGSILPTASGVRLAAREAVATVGERTFALTSAGIAQFRPHFQVVSDAIKDTIDHMLERRSAAIAAHAFAIPDEAEGRVLFWVPRDSEAVLSSQAYVLDLEADQWTTWTLPATAGLRHPTQGRLYLGAPDGGAIWRERMTLTAGDQRDGEEAITSVVEWGLIAPEGRFTNLHLPGGYLRFQEAAFTSGTVQVTNDFLPALSGATTVAPAGGATSSSADVGFSVPEDYRDARGWTVRFTHATVDERFKLVGVGLRYLK